MSPIHRAQMILSSKQYFCRNFLFLVHSLSVCLSVTSSVGDKAVMMCSALLVLAIGSADRSIDRTCRGADRSNHSFHCRITANYQPLARMDGLSAAGGRLQPDPITSWPLLAVLLETVELRQLDNDMWPRYLSLSLSLSLSVSLVIASQRQRRKLQINGGCCWCWYSRCNWYSQRRFTLSRPVTVWNSLSLRAYTSGLSKNLKDHYKEKCSHGNDTENKEVLSFRCQWPWELSAAAGDVVVEPPAQVVFATCIDVSRGTSKVLEHSSLELYAQGKFFVTINNQTSAVHTQSIH